MSANTTVDLITVTEYQTYAGQQQADKHTDQEQQEFMITAASEAFSDMVGYNLLSVARTEEFDGHNGLRQYTRVTPITVTPVLSFWNDTSFTVAGTDNYPRQVDNASGLIRMTSASFFRVRWKIEYTAGYVVADVPFDVKEVVCQMVQRSIARISGKEGVTSESFEVQSSTFDFAMMATDKIKRTAARYRRQTN